MLYICLRACRYRWYSCWFLMLVLTCLLLAVSAHHLVEFYLAMGDATGKTQPYAVCKIEVLLHLILQSHSRPAFRLLSHIVRAVCVLQLSHISYVAPVPSRADPNTQTCSQLLRKTMASVHGAWQLRVSSKQANILDYAQSALAHLVCKTL